MAGLALDLGAWVRDYAYALRHQAAGILDRGDPRAFRRPGAGRPAVLLLPGIYEEWTFMRPLAQVLWRDGYDVHPLEDMGRNSGTIEDMAGVVDRYIRSAGLQDCVLVAHSKGGLIGKYLLAHHNAATAIRGLVAVNTPFAGSVLAWLLPLPAVRVFLPHSPVLAALASSADVNGRIVSVYGLFDPHIPGGSRLEGARNVRLDTRGHFLPLGDARVHRAVLEGVASLAR
ncbi:hypothetical protein [Citricoccus sp. SGAir0253]|uniref:hypothetical protein n=1 Tax=Citricoccus sp. SGAir0253 TaxID=2567881 RepID=UPI001FEEFF62|nr:hypothetical protein [Citricoccus sp. SGAir0253]